MKEKFKYELSTGLAGVSFDRMFASDRAAWNILAKSLNKHYKSGRYVSAILYKYVPTVTPFIHKAEHERRFPDQKTIDEDRHIKVPVLSGFICFDYDGNRWPPIEISESYNLANLDATRVAVTSWSDAQNVNIRKLIGMDEHKEETVERLTLKQLKPLVSDDVYQTLLCELEANYVKVKA